MLFRTTTSYTDFCGTVLTSITEMLILIRTYDKLYDGFKNSGMQVILLESSLVKFAKFTLPFSTSPFVWKSTWEEERWPELNTRSKICLTQIFLNSKKRWILFKRWKLAFSSGRKVHSKRKHSKNCKVSQEHWTLSQGSCPFYLRSCNLLRKRWNSPWKKL